MNAVVGAATRDGRDSRWDAHRAARREELLEAALQSVRGRGPDVAVEHVAAAAGTSKPAVYRYFPDKAALHSAVCDHVAERLLARLRAAVRTAAGPRDALAAAADAYLDVVERDPDVYRFVVAGPVDALAARVGAAASELIGDVLRAAGADPAPARAWGHGLVGMARAAGDDWIGTSPRPPRSALVASLVDLAWGGLSAAVPPQTGHGTGRDHAHEHGGTR